jgi:hypothetical protein
MEVSVMRSRGSTETCRLWASGEGDMNRLCRWEILELANRVLLDHGLDLAAIAVLGMHPPGNPYLCPPDDLNHIHSLLSIHIPEPPPQTLPPGSVDIPRLIKDPLQIPVNLRQLGQAEMVVVPFEDWEGLGVFVGGPQVDLDGEVV